VRERGWRAETGGERDGRSRGKTYALPLPLPLPRGRRRDKGHGRGGDPSGNLTAITPTSTPSLVGGPAVNTPPSPIAYMAAAEGFWDGAECLAVESNRRRYLLERQETARAPVRSAWSES
jgi:hypothetical protein